MSMMVLGNEAPRAVGGILSSSLDTFAYQSRTAAIRRFRTDRLKTSREWQFPHTIDTNSSWEDIRRVLDLRVPRGMDRRLQPTALGLEDFLQDLDVRVPQIRHRRVQPARFVSEPLPPQGRLSGPIQFIKNLLVTWKLGLNDAVPLLGFEQSDQTYVDALLSGHVALKGRDVKDRIAYLLYIRSTLSALFQNEETENEWLREQHAMLDNQVPIGLLLEGSMENLLLIKEYVDTVAGR